MVIGKGTGKKQRCRKANVFPCKTRCVPRYNSRSGKEQRCQNVAEGTPSTYLEWVKSQGQRKKQINTDRKEKGLTLLKSDSAGYLVNPDKNKKGKLPTSYRKKAEEARKIGAESKDPKIKALAEKTAKKAEAVAEKAEELTAPAQDELSRSQGRKPKSTEQAPVEPAPKQTKPKRRAAKEKPAPKPKSPTGAEVAKDLLWMMENTMEGESPEKILKVWIAENGKISPSIQSRALNMVYRKLDSGAVKPKPKQSQDSDSNPSPAPSRNTTPQETTKIRAFKTPQDVIQRGQEIADEFIAKISSQERSKVNLLQAELKKINTKLWEIEKEYGAAVKTKDLLRQKQLRERVAELSNIKSKLRPELNNLREKEKGIIDYNGLLSKLHSLSGIDEATAKKIVEGITFDDSIQTSPLDGDIFAHDISSIKNDMIDFMRIAGNKVSIDRVFQDPNSPRAYAASVKLGRPDNAINIGSPMDFINNTEHKMLDQSGGMRRVVFHESAHYIEFSDQNIAQMAQLWVKSRATGDPQPLGGRYEEHEVAYPDDFIDPYVGIYRDERVITTEVISMGVQHMINSKKASELYRTDKEHFYFTIGAIAGNQD